MMYNIIGVLMVYGGLNCPMTKVVNHTDKWTAYDESVLKTAQTRCPELYKKSPCVKEFRKTGALSYQVICAAGRD